VLQNWRQARLSNINGEAECVAAGDSSALEGGLSNGTVIE
jgi:hypothetical protein